MRGPGTAAMLAGIALTSCAAPSRQLTPRVVEDPIVLPKRMASVSAHIDYVHYEPTNVNRTSVPAGLRFGLTNRLELVALGLRFAILDDRPADGRTPMPFSLAVRAGVVAIGYSSIEGMLVQPVAELSLLKHVADRWALSSQLFWIAHWSQYPWQVFPASYDGALRYTSRIASTFTLSAAVTRQLAERTALGIVPAVHQTNACVDPTCDWVSRGASVALRVHQRPWHWLTVSLGPEVGVRWRPDVPLPTMYPDGTPRDIPPMSVTWFGGSATAAFYW